MHGLLECEQQEALQAFCMLLPLPHSPRENWNGFMPGCTRDDLQSALQSATTCSVLKTPLVQVMRYEGLPCAQVQVLSAARLRYLVQMKAVSEELTVYVRYRFGNVFAFIDRSCISAQCLLTTQGWCARHTRTGELWQVNVGEWFSPNRLYEQRQLDGKSAPLVKMLRIPHFLSYALFDLERDDCSDIPH